MGSSAIKINKFNYFGRCSTDNIEFVTEYVSTKIRPLIKARLFVLLWFPFLALLSDANGRAHNK